MTDENKTPNPAPSAPSVDANAVGVTNRFSSELLGELVDLFAVVSISFLSLSLNFGVRDTKFLFEAIFASAFSHRQILATAMVCGLSQSSKRIKAGVEAMPESSQLRKLVEPIVVIMGQQGMTEIHTPSHYSSSMPGLALLGRTLVAIGQNMEMAFDMGDLFFPGFGGLSLDNYVQSWHQRKTQQYFDNMVKGASFSEKWYNLTKIDQHVLIVPSWLVGKMSFEEFHVPNMKITSKVLVAFVASVVLASSSYIPKNFSWSINGCTEDSLDDFFSDRLGTFHNWVKRISTDQAWPATKINDRMPTDNLARAMMYSWALMLTARRPQAQALPAAAPIAAPLPVPAPVAAPSPVPAPFLTPLPTPKPKPQGKPKPQSKPKPKTKLKPASPPAPITASSPPVEATPESQPEEKAEKDFKQDDLDAAEGALHLGFLELSDDELSKIIAEESTKLLENFYTEVKDIMVGNKFNNFADVLVANAFLKELEILTARSGLKGMAPEFTPSDFRKTLYYLSQVDARDPAIGDCVSAILRMSSEEISEPNWVEATQRVIEVIKTGLA